MHIGQLRFADHSSFHRATAGMVGGALVAGLGLHYATGGAHVAPLIGGLAGIAVGGAWGYGRTAARSVAVALATVPLFTMAMAWSTVALIAEIVALGMAIGGPRGVRGVVGVALTAATVVLAMWCALRVDTARETLAWPGALTDAVAAGALGMVAVLSLLPRHLGLARDPVTAAVRGLPVGLDAELRGLCTRAIAIWTTTERVLDDSDPGKALVRDGVLKTLEVAVRGAGSGVTGAGDDDLAARMTELDRRIAASTDDDARTQYQAARAALDDQRRYRERIATGRERLVARMHNHVAALEKFQLAATGLEVSRASAQAGAGTQLEDLSQDVAASSEALAEIELGVAGPAPTVASASPATA